MFDWLRKLYGKGTARYSFVLSDGRSGNAKLPYIGEWDNAEAERAVKSKLLVEYGSPVITIKFIGRTEE